MGLKLESKEARRLADEAERAATQEAIKRTKEPPEDSEFSPAGKQRRAEHANRMRALAYTLAAGAAVVGASLLYGAHKKKKDSSK